MPQDTQQIFISYAWGGDGEEFVNRLDRAFQEKGVTIIRDKRDLGYKGLIKEFMKQIGRGKCVIAVISDKYLKSRNCMFELLEVSKNGKFYDRIFPITLSDAKIYNPVDRIDYIIHWENEIQKLDAKLKMLSSNANLITLQQAITEYAEFRAMIDQLTYTLQNMNTLTPDIHSQSDFEALFRTLELKLSESDLDKSELDAQKAEIREEFEKVLQRIDIQKSKNNLRTPSETPEIKLEARDILNLIISPRDIKKLSNNQGERVSKEKVYYEYYTLERKGLIEGYLFLGKNVTNKNLFSFFCNKNIDNFPNKLEIFLVKKIAGQKIVDKKKDLYENCKQYGLSDIVGNEIHYIDDFVWEHTISDNDNFQAYKRQDFIDQKIYKEIDDCSLQQISNESISLFIDELNNDNSPSISIVYGSGGVGKTTFCETLRYAIVQDPKIRKKVFYIKGERVVEFSLSDNKEIKLLDDLYDLYKDDTDEFNEISHENFKLNFIIGNIVVIIDAIEEIESALNERFNLTSFFESLKSLHERFLCTKIIVTTREHFLPKIKDIQDEFLSIDYYCLQGFEPSNLDEFLTKKYKKDVQKIQKVKDFIEENRLFYDDHIIPLLVDWVCLIIDRPEQKYLQESQYFIIDENMDKILINLLSREIGKQSLNIDVDGMFELLETIVVEHNGIMPQQAFDEQTQVLYDQDSSNYLKNPLLINQNNTVRIKYDILPNLIKSRSLIHMLADEQESVLDTNKVTSILKDCYQGQGEIFYKVVHICKQKKLNIQEIIKSFIKKLNKSFNNGTKEIQKENIRKSISALLHLLNKCQSPSDRNERMLMIKEVYDSAKSNTLTGLYIYGDFEALDFSNVTINDSYFDGYTNFYKSKFPEEDKIVFYHTKFKKFNIPRTQHIKNSHFDSSCIFTDCNIDDITNTNLSKENKKTEQLKKDIISLISFIDTSQRSLNLIKQKCSISYSKGVKKLLDILIQENFLVPVQKHNQDLYKINQKFYDNIPNIKLGNFPPELESILEEIIK